MVILLKKKDTIKGESEEGVDYLKNKKTNNCDFSYVDSLNVSSIITEEMTTLENADNSLEQNESIKSDINEISNCFLYITINNYGNDIEEDYQNTFELVQLKNNIRQRKVLITTLMEDPHLSNKIYECLETILYVAFNYNE